MMVKHREMAIDIVNLFEEFLEQRNIYIPDPDRKGDEGEACLYGGSYYELEDAVTQYLEMKFD